MIIDTNNSCVGKSQFLKTKGVTAVGRYYRLATHPTWKLTKSEAEELSKAGINIFVVFEDYGKAADFNLSKHQGQIDGVEALKQAQAVGQPPGSAIYFAVEGLPSGYTHEDLPGIRDYFSGVASAVGGKYALGVYSDGIVCKTLLDEGICAKAWLSASMGFEGSRDFQRSNRWSIWQKTPIDVTDGWNGLSVDFDDVNGDFGAFVVPVPAV